MWLLLPLWSDWRSWLFGLHCLRVQSFHTAWLWTQPPTRLVPCDWAVCVDHEVMSLVVGFDKRLYFYTGFSRLAIHGGECLGSLSLVVGFELNWVFFPVPHLLELCEVAHMLDVLLGPFMTCLLPVYTNVVLWQHRGVDSWDSASHWHTPWLAPSYVLFPWTSGPVGSAWPQWACLCCSQDDTHDFVLHSAEPEQAGLCLFVVCLLVA